MWLVSVAASWATPANRAALERHYDRFLAKSLAQCTTCHQPSEKKNPESLEEFPHNAFGHRLRLLGEELRASGKKRDLASRLRLIADEDSDVDGAPNELELLLGHNPGDATNKPDAAKLASASERRAEFANFLTSYRWQPFEPVHRPPIPAITNAHSSFSSPIDAFLDAERRAHGLRARSEASREVLLRRVTIDLIGLNPTPEEQRAFLADTSPDAYEKVVDRLLADPRFGERWGRHWMDVWRYSDWAGWTDGGQIRDSKPHIWRWRDWIVESLNDDKPYDAMIREMLAADESSPEDTNALRATGFLVRNYKMLSREQWMEDTIKHTYQAFLGVTMGCAKCHDHMFDPISQRDYYAARAIFEPHQVRTDRVPGQTNTALDGLVRAYDAANAPTYFFVRGDERHPLTNEVIAPGVPLSLGGSLTWQEVKLPRFAAWPDKREFVIRDQIAAAEKALRDARKTAVRATEAKTNAADKLVELELSADLAEQQHAALLAVVAAERVGDEIEAAGGVRSASSDESCPTLWERAARDAVAAQRRVSLADAKWKHHQTRRSRDEAERKLDSALRGDGSARGDEAKVKAGLDTAEKALAEARKKLTDADSAFATAETELAKPLTTHFKPRPAESYPATSTGRRLAFARWIANPQNPLTARVAVNHVWLRHFGRGLVTSPSDFGRNGRAPTHPQLLDWLAAEFMARDWSFKQLHRLIVTSAAYRMASTSDDACAAIDPDNVFLWHMNSRRLEAEAVRDNVLFVGGALDATRGGPDIDCKDALTSRRRSIYLRHAAEKQAEFLQIFDGPSVTECYERHPSVMPQQALALANSQLALDQARVLAAALAKESEGDERRFVELAFRRVLARAPTGEELKRCVEFLAPTRTQLTTENAKPARAAENFVLVLFNHNDFVTVR